MENTEKKRIRKGRPANLKLIPSPIQIYIDKKNFTLTRFAKMCNIALPTVRRFYDGDQPSYLIAKRIASKTNQEITLNDLGYER